MPPRTSHSIVCMSALLETLLAVLLCIGVAFLPPWLVVLVWLGALGAFALSFAIERRGQGRAPHFTRALSGLMPLSLALSLALWAWPLVGPWLALPLALGALVIGVLLHGRVFRWMLRPRMELAARYPFTSEHALSGPGGHVWSRLPGSGLRFRLVPGAKPRSSQPQGCTWVFEDGHVLEGRDRSLHVSRDGRWLVVRSLRAAPLLDRWRRAMGTDRGLRALAEIDRAVAPACRPGRAAAAAIRAVAERGRGASRRAGSHRDSRSAGEAASGLRRPA